VKIRLHGTEDQAHEVASRRSRLVMAAVPVVLDNAVAFAGQLAFLRDHLPWPLAGQIMMAAALESVAVYLAYHAHVAALANDSALRLRLAAYGFAAVIATMNYSHYAGPGWRPTFAAVAVALCSAASPWLWGVHSRRASRDQLLAAGLVEPHALRLGATRWLWHPVRSARVMYHATWAGVTDPREAIAGQDARRYPGAPAVAPGASRDAAAVTHGGAPALPPGDASGARQPKASGRASRSSVRRASPADMEASALAVLASQPDIGGAELGRAIGASPRTGQRLLARLSSREAGGDDGAQATGPAGLPPEILSRPGPGPGPVST
jgi:hypothetical protein